ncbi:hypothetical protein [Photobacterium sanguinicancri]|uniref:Uncharacterized protein n=1 Tax=Photobacterium sanguinicancri TaxID=875932 RepID=A0ABX4FTU1_9GAMM|nr:hypothetical protein [Photobacterium sanguinicancri]OZS42296.1 hypothetical protein ASV53_19235 [Photobacterium sanguinicancri]
MGGGKKKRGIAAAAPKANQGKGGTSRLTVNESATDYEDSQIVFSLERVVSGKYCYSKLDKDHKAAFADAIFKRKSFTWKSIQEEGRHGLGYEKISKKSIKTGVPDFIPPDLKNFLAFRFKGKAPLVGYRRRNIFYVLWFDHNFTVYPHKNA